MGGVFSTSILPVKQTVSLPFSSKEMLYEEDDNCFELVMN